MSKYSDEVVRDFIEIEKMLCDALGRSWKPYGMSIETLILEIKAALAARQDGVGRGKLARFLTPEAWYDRETGPDGECYCQQCQGARAAERELAHEQAERILRFLGLEQGQKKSRPKRT